MTHTPTPQQALVRDSIAEGPAGPSVTVEAVAGSGKTHTLVLGLNAMSPIARLDCAAFAFNKRIVTELQTKAPPGSRIATLNSIGHRAVCEALGKRPSPDKWKTRNLIKRRFGEDTDAVLEEWPDLPHAVAMCKANALEPSAPEDQWAFEEISFNSVGAAQSAKAADTLRKLLQDSIEAAQRKGEIDFDDQLYLSAMRYSPFLPKLRMALIDEAQDLSPVQHRMLQKMLGSNGTKGRLVAVGDPYQAIYAFRGADSSSMNTLRGAFGIAPEHQLPLSVSFRCPKAVVELAKKLVPHISSAPEAKDGSVRSEPQDKLYELARAGDAVLCRNNAPLMSCALAFLSKRRPVQILGRDLHVGLASIVKRLTGETCAELRKALEEWEVLEVTILQSRQQSESKLNAVHDRAAALRAIFEDLQPTDTRAKALEVLAYLFEDKAQAVLLATGHKAKGLEWPRVFILEPNLLPSRWAKTDGAREQERNLQYVLITRAQEELIFLGEVW